MLRSARAQPSALLLATQIAGLLLYPFMEQSFAGRALLSVFGIVVLRLVVLAVSRSPAATWVGLALGVPATILLLIQAATDSERLLPYSSGFEAVLYFYAAGALIAYMLSDQRITRDGVPWATPHALRHGLASLMAERGCSAAQIAAHLGHADGRVLALRVYIHAEPVAATSSTTG